MSKRNRLSIGILFMGIAAIMVLGRMKFSNADEMLSSEPISCEVIVREETLLNPLENIGPNNLDSNPNSTQRPLIGIDTFIADECLIVESNSSLTQDTSDKVKEEEKAAETFASFVQQKRDEALEVVNITNPDITVSAKSAVLLRTSDGEVLYAKKALKKIQPASTAKLLTAIVALELSEEDEEFHVGKEIELIASDSSRAYLRSGQVLSLDHILDALLLPSGNDAAYVIATNLGRKIANDESLKPKKAVKLFVQKMNEKAIEIGAVNSNFLSPDGYDKKGQYTTAYDMALIGASSLQYELIRSVVKKPKARDILLSGDDVTWYNSNKLIKNGSGYFYDYAIGLKTGSSGEAGRCLVSAATKKKDTYISVVMDASYEGRWQDSIDLLSYGIRNESK